MINQLIGQDFGCVDALSILMGFNSLQSQIYFTLAQEGKKTVSQLCDIAKRNQSTVYTALEKLVAQGVCTKKKRSRKPRGYEYVYDAVDPKIVKEKLHERLDKVYTLMEKCIDTFDNTALKCELNY